MRVLPTAIQMASVSLFEGRGVRIFRDNHAASQSPIADCVKQYKIKSLNVIAHIRKATQGGVTIENTHPFIREIWDKTGCLLTTVI